MGRALLPLNSCRLVLRTMERLIVNAPHDKSRVHPQADETLTHYPKTSSGSSQVRIHFHLNDAGNYEIIGNSEVSVQMNLPFESKFRASELSILRSQTPQIKNEVSIATAICPQRGQTCSSFMRLTLSTSLRLTLR